MMKNDKLIRFGSVILFAFLALGSVRAAEPKVDVVMPGQPSGFVSVFKDDRNFGKDPFFPKSTRRSQQATVATNWVPREGELPAGMVLKGLSGTKDKPLAIINNYTFAEGEEAEVRVIHQLFRVKVIEIKERSVIISVNGTPPRELALRQGL